MGWREFEVPKTSAVPRALSLSFCLLLVDQDVGFPMFLLPHLRSAIMDSNLLTISLTECFLAQVILVMVFCYNNIKAAKTDPNTTKKYKLV